MLSGPAGILAFRASTGSHYSFVKVYGLAVKSKVMSTASGNAQLAALVATKVITYMALQLAHKAHTSHASLNRPPGGLRLVLSHTARDPDPPVYCRDSFGDIFTLTSRVEPNYRQDLTYRDTAIHNSQA